MFNKEQFIHSVRMEANICKHLYEKIPADSLSASDSVSTVGAGIAAVSGCMLCCAHANILKNDWSRGDTLAQYQSLPAEDFPDMMDKQVRSGKTVAAVFRRELPDMKTSTPMGTESAVGSCTVNLP